MVDSVIGGIGVEISGDATGVQAAATDTNAALDQVVVHTKTLSDEFKMMATAAEASMAKAVSAAKDTVLQVQKTAVAMREAREAVIGFGNALLAAFAVREVMDWAQKRGESGERLVHLGQALGLTGTQMQHLQVMATMGGTSVEALGHSVMRLDRAYDQAQRGNKMLAQDFHAIGVSTTEVRDPMNLLMATIHGVATHSNDTAVSMALLGRGMLTSAGVFHMTKEELDNVNGAIVRYGVENQHALDATTALARQMNENKVAMIGVGNIMAEVFAPPLTTLVRGLNELAANFVKSYNAGGQAKKGMDDLAVVSQVLITLAAMLGVGFYDAGLVIVQSMKTAYEAGEWLRAKLDGDKVQMLADQVEISYGWISVARHIQDASDSLNKFADAEKSAKAAAGGVDSLGGPKADTGAGAGAKGQASKMQEWQEQLSDAEDAMRGKTVGWLADMSSYEADFWQTKLASAKAGSAQYLEIQRKIMEDRKRMEADAAAEQLAGDKADIAASKNNWAQSLAGWQRYVDDVATWYGKDTKQYRAALAEQAKALQEHNTQMVAETVKGIEEATSRAVEALKGQQQIAKLGEEEQKRILDDRIAMVGASGARIHQMKLQQLQMDFDTERQFAAQEEALKEAGLRKELAAMDAAGQSETKERKAVYAQLLALQQAYQIAAAAAQTTFENAKADETRANIDRVVGEWRSATAQIVNAFGTGVDGMITHAKTFQQALMGVVGTIRQMLIQAVEKWVTTQIMAFAEAKIAAFMNSRAQVAGAAAVADANATASAAANPLTFMAAPAFGAAMMAEVMAISIPSSEGGMWRVPQTTGAILHKDETVLPAWAADSWRNMVQGGNGPTDNAGSHHTWNVHAMDARSFQRFLRGPAGQVMVDEFIDRHRNGAGAGMLNGATG